jgi:putative DNA primase/helicase
MTVPKPGIDLPALRAALVSHAAGVALAVLGQPNQALSSRRELRFGNKGSLAVVVAGEKAGLWYDYKSGRGGNLFDLLLRTRSGDFAKAISFAKNVVGPAPAYSAPRITKPVSKEETSRVQAALTLWNEAVSITGTLASRYLELRRVLEPALQAGDGVLRFHPHCPFGEGSRHPCLLALLRDIRTNEPRAIQRTAIRATGEKLGRMTLGPKTGTAIKLTGDEDVTNGLAIGEGTETVLGGIALGFSPAWALGDACGVESFPVLPGIEALTIFVDHDESGTGQHAARECSCRWTAAGREVLRVVPNALGDDMNDVLRKRASHE